MKKFLTEKKWLVLSALAILVLALVIGIVAIAGGGEKDPDPTEGTSNVGDSTGTTGGNGNEITDPSNPSDVTDPTDPDVPIGDYDPDAPPTPIQPIDPDTVLPPEGDDDELAVEDPNNPTEPAPTPDHNSGFSGDSYVGNPEDDDQTVVEPNPTVPKPDPEPTYDFTGVTAGNLTLELWNSWSREKQQAYLLTEPLNENSTLDDKYNFWCVYQYNGGYDCGFEGHYCLSEAGHNKVLAAMEEGCYYCGAKDCVSFYARDDAYGYTITNFEKCPKYHNNCEVCGLPNNGKSGELTCTRYLKDVNCYWCGEFVKAGECHPCITP